MTTRRSDFFKQFPGSPPPAPKRKRLAMADHLIASERLKGVKRTDESIYVEVGFANADEYWRDATAAVMELPDFVHQFAIHFLQPEGGSAYYKLDLEDALRFAAENGEPWFIKLDRGELRLHPREAAVYLLAQPKCEHLVPPGLKTFLESQKPSVAIQTIPPAAKRSRQSAWQTDRIIKEMMAMDPTELARLTQKEMRHRFRAARSTCKNARQKALAQFKPVQSRESIDIDRQ
jgi:hypothetical protein